MGTRWPVGGGHTEESVTSMFPRMALLYGHTAWAPSMRVDAVVSSTSGMCASIATARPNPPPSMVPRVTLTDTVEPSTLTLLRRATTPSALWKHAAYPAANSSSGLVGATRAAQLHRRLQVEVQ